MEFERKGLRIQNDQFQAFYEKKRISIPGQEEKPEKKKAVEEKEKQKSQWSMVGDNFVPAATGIVGAFKSLNVPENEVIAAANKLKTTDK